MEVNQYDFSGYVTKANMKCSDGRVISDEAFAHQSGAKVPLVWNHQHNTPDNVLGHAVLEERDDGVYGYCTFNNSEGAQTAKELVAHGDINAMSIYANQLVEKGSRVMHGNICEVSLVLNGANPGAKIENVSIAHSDGNVEFLDGEAVIYNNNNIDKVLRHADDDDDDDDDSDETESDERTIGDILDTMTEEQQQVVAYLVGVAARKGSGSSDEVEHSSMTYKEDTALKVNAFDNNTAPEKNTLSHSQIQTIFTDAKSMGSLKESFLAHADDYGITDIDYLFPDAKTQQNSPEFIKRDTAWVSSVLNGTHHSPFSRVKVMQADITADEARAKGYIKGNYKKEEVIKLMKRVTTPTTIYKKQKLDRDDITDITDLDVVAWLKSEMRVMLDEEIARAILIGDGREADDEDKINEENIRPIWTDDDMYTDKVQVASDATPSDIIESIIRARKDYKGTGTPTFFTTNEVLIDMLLITDSIGRRLYNTEEELRSALRVSNIVTVEVMEGASREDDDGNTLNLLGILVNLSDYTVGADKGGEISMFDDFDIDYNQYKYLMETRMSGALVKYKSAQVIEQVASSDSETE